MIVKSYFETAVASSIVLFLSFFSLNEGISYLENARKAVIEAQIKECVKEINYRNIFNETPFYKCLLKNGNEKNTIILFFDKKKSVAYSYEKVFRFEFGKDIICVVKNNNSLCFFR